jgi:ketosteroid isomerase-like protein
MSRENVEVVRQIYNAWNEGDISTLVKLFGDDVELRLNVMMGPYLGRKGVRQFVADLQADWRELCMTVEETFDAGDRVVAVIHEHGVGRKSRVPITSTENHVWTVHDGRARRAVAFASRSKALEAVGLSG